MLYVFALTPVVLFVLIVAVAVVRWQLQTEAREAALQQSAAQSQPAPEPPASEPPRSVRGEAAVHAAEERAQPIGSPISLDPDDAELSTVVFSDGMVEDGDVVGEALPRGDDASAEDEPEGQDEPDTSDPEPEEWVDDPPTEPGPQPPQSTAAEPAAMGLDAGLSMLPFNRAVPEHPEHGTIVPTGDLFDEDSMATVVVGKNHDALDEEAMRTVIQREPEPTTFADEAAEGTEDAGPGSIEEVYRLGAIGALARHLGLQALIDGRAWSIDLDADQFVVGTGENQSAWPLNIIGRVAADGRFHWAWADADDRWSRRAIAASVALRELVVPELREEVLSMDDTRRYVLFVSVSTLDGRPWFYARSEDGGGLLLLVDQRVEITEAVLRKALAGFKMLGPEIDHLEAIDGAANLLALDFDYDGQILTLFAPDGEVELRFDGNGHCVLV